MKAQKREYGAGLLDHVENVSSEIQLLALNIAVAAAKMAHKRNLGLEVNHKLSRLVSQATQAVKHMNQILSAAKTEKISGGIFSDQRGGLVDRELIENIETALSGIIKDSERIVKLLAAVRRR